MAKNDVILEPATYSVKEAAQVIGIHYLTAYELVKQGKLPSMRAGKRILVPRLALHKLIERGVDSSLPSIGD